MAAGELVADGDVAQLRDLDDDLLDDAAFELVARFAGEYLDADDAAALAAFHAERGVLHVLCLVAEDGAEEALFRSELGLALRSDLADEDVARAHFCADADDALLVEVPELAFRRRSGCRAS